MARFPKAKAEIAALVEAIKSNIGYSENTSGNPQSDISRADYRQGVGISYYRSKQSRRWRTVKYSDGSAVKLSIFKVTISQ